MISLANFCPGPPRHTARTCSFNSLCRCKLTVTIQQRSTRGSKIKRKSTVNDTGLSEDWNKRGVQVYLWQALLVFWRGCIVPTLHCTADQARLLISKMAEFSELGKHCELDLCKQLGKQLRSDLHIGWICNICSLRSFPSLATRVTSSYIDWLIDWLIVLLFYFLADFLPFTCSGCSAVFWWVCLWPNNNVSIMGDIIKQQNKGWGNYCMNFGGNWTSSVIVIYI